MLLKKCRLNFLEPPRRRTWPKRGAVASPSSGAPCGARAREPSCPRLLHGSMYLTRELALRARAGRKTGREESPPREEAEMVQSTNAPALVSSGFKRRQAQRAAQVCCRGVQGARTHAASPCRCSCCRPCPRRTDWDRGTAGAGGGRQRRGEEKQAQANDRRVVASHQGCEWHDPLQFCTCPLCGAMPAIQPLSA